MYEKSDVLFYLKVLVSGNKIQYTLSLMNKLFKTKITLFLICCISIVMLQKLNISYLPKEKQVSFSIIYQSLNTSPEQTEQDATSIIENFFSQARNLKAITSTSGYNYGKVDLFFDDKVDIEEKKFELMSMLRQLKNKLPSGVSYPTLLAANKANEIINKSPSLVYTVSGVDINEQTESTISTLLKRAVQTIEGVQDLEVLGFQQTELIVSYDLKKLKTYNLNQSDIVNVFEENARIVDFGTVAFENNTAAFVRLLNNEKEIDDYENLTFSNNKNIKLRDVSNLTIAPKKSVQFSRVNGKPCLTVNIYLNKSTNTLVTTRKIKEKINELRNKLPSHTRLFIEFDEAGTFKSEVTDVIKRISILATGIITLLSFYYFGNFTLIFSTLTRLAIIFCLSIIGFWSFDVEININSANGFLISLFISTLITLMCDFLCRSQIQKKNIIGCLIGVVSIILGAILIYDFNAQIDGENTIVSSFNVLIICCIASLLTNLLFVSNFDSTGNLNKKKLFRNKFKEDSFKRFYFRMMTFILPGRLIFTVILILCFGFPLFLLQERTEDSKQNIFLVNNEFFTIINMALGGFMRPFLENLNVNPEYGNDHETKLIISGGLSMDPSNGHLDQVYGRLENYIAKFKGIKRYKTFVKSERNFSIEIFFNSNNENSVLPVRIKNQIVSAVQEFGGVKWNIYGIGRGFSNITDENMPSFKILVSGYNYVDLKEQCASFGTALKVNKRVTEINLDDGYRDKDSKILERKLSLNHNNLLIYNATPEQLSQALRESFSENTTISPMKNSNKDLQVLITEKKDMNWDFWKLEHGYIEISNNKTLAANGTIRIVESPSTTTISKINREYVKVISFKYMGEYKNGIAFLKTALNKYNLTAPIGYRAETRSFSSETDFKKSYNDLIIILEILLLFYVIYSLTFENLNAFKILFMLVISSITGSFIAFYVFDSVSFDQGFILGTIVNIFFISILWACLSSQIFSIKSKDNFGEKVTDIFLDDLPLCLFGFFAIQICTIPILFTEGNKYIWSSFALSLMSQSLSTLLAIYFIIPLFLMKDYSSIKK